MKRVDLVKPEFDKVVDTKFTWTAAIPPLFVSIFSTKF